MFLDMWGFWTYQFYCSSNSTDLIVYDSLFWDYLRKQVFVNKLTIISQLKTNERNEIRAIPPDILRKVMNKVLKMTFYLHIFIYIQVNNILYLYIAFKSKSIETELHRLHIFTILSLIKLDRARSKLVAGDNVFLTN